MGEMAVGFVDEERLSFQSTPIFWSGKLYLTSAIGQVFAVDAATGKELWRFNPDIPKDVYYGEFASRGVSIWHVQGEGEGLCSHRIFSGTLTGGLYSLDANTGELCEAFADKGFLDLRTLAGSDRIGNYTITSPPVGLTTVPLLQAQPMSGHHDVWDYDLPAQPVLFTLQRDGKEIPAVVQATKMGMLFIFNHLTGEPLFDVIERPIPQSDVAGEKLSSTQPFSAPPWITIFVPSIPRQGRSSGSKICRALAWLRP